jgi:DUF971 family protein
LSPAPRLTPRAIEQVGDRRVVVTWGDGHESQYDASGLRAKCPCATCGQEKGGAAAHEPLKIGLGQPLPLLPAKARPDVALRDIEAVGHYALRFTFSDGHETGIYSYEYLRGLCRCAECRAAGAGGSTVPNAPPDPPPTR